MADSSVPFRPRRLLVTGGAGFIGSHFLRYLLSGKGDGASPFPEKVVNLDKLTYAGNLSTVADLATNPNYTFVQGDLADIPMVKALLEEHQIDSIVHLAAESHVDRSISTPENFLHTNVVGTFRLLDCAKRYVESLENPNAFRFLHVSTDEVYGSLKPEDEPFDEGTLYEPNSPYSASKAASDHFARAYFHTYGLPVIITHCSNNYGPGQFPEKLIPVIIRNALADKPLPIYGDGSNIRDWLYVEDHCQGLWLALTKGEPGEIYNMGGNCERSNVDLVDAICHILDELAPRQDGASHRAQKMWVPDRPGHDFRYAMNAAKISKQLGWYPQEKIESGLRKTVEWYMAHPHWPEKQ